MYFGTNVNTHLFDTANETGVCERTATIACGQ